MPAMVSQSQDWCESGNPSRAGSVMSLDGGRQVQRPSSAKTPPSYYDAVRSRHSLSQPLNKPKQQQQQQQLKYNSLPRPLPQRVPPTNGQGPPRPYVELPRQMYDSPPKPANHVPLQVHQEKEAPRLNRTMQEKGMENGVPRGNLELLRKEGYRNIPLRTDVRPPPPVPGMRAPFPSRQDGVVPNSSSLPRRDPAQGAEMLRRCYPLPSDGAPQPSYPQARSSMNGTPHYEPRFSKSGKLCSKPLSQGPFEPRPMPAPAVQLRTGPLGSYPDAETLKKSEMVRHLERNYSPGSMVDYDRQQQRMVPQRGDMSQQIFVDTNSYVNSHPMVADHLAIPYRIPQVSPKNTRPLMDGKKMCNGKETSPGPRNKTQTTSPANGVGYSHSQLLANRRNPSDGGNTMLDHRNRRHSENSLIQPIENGHLYGNYSNNSLKSLSPSDSRSDLSNGDSDVIYANHQMSTQTRNPHKIESQRSGSQRTPPASNGCIYEKPQAPCPPMKNGFRDPRECSQDNVFVYSSHPNYNQMYNQKEDHHLVYESTRIDRRLPPPVAQKPRPSLPQPSDMVMVTETRGWNGQANSFSKDMVKPAETRGWNNQSNAHSKDSTKPPEPVLWNGQTNNSLVKPTPRMPRFMPQTVSVPAYQCVINELSGQQQFFPAGSPNPSLRSGYDSSSTSSIRDYARKPIKSDSAVEQSKNSFGSLKLRSEQSHLSASMSSLCSDTSSSISSRRRHDDSGSTCNAWERMNDELKKRKDNGSVFSASPWEREEKEKLQLEQLCESRRLRDREISLLESLDSRTDKQEEWLRILRLEREFQRRAEQEDEDEEDDEEELEEETSVCSESSSRTDSEKTEDLHGDKLTVIPNERLGLKLLDDLLDSPPKSATGVPPELKCEPSSLSMSTSEKHFIPLELTIPDRDMHQPSSLPNLSSSNGNNILQVYENQEHSGSNRLSKPPIPAPRPSKVFTPIILSDANSSDVAPEIKNPDTSSLTKLDISDSAYFCVPDNDRSGDIPQDTWLIEVNSFDVPHTPKQQQNGDQMKEESRIYENIKPFDASNSQLISRSNEFGSHTLPKSTSQSLTPRDFPKRDIMEKKFPTMGISSTLSRKSNGLTEADIIPTLYATSKVRSAFTPKEHIPSDLVDKSPEFKKLWISRPEKLTFQDKIRKFSFQAGENDLPRDRVKNSRAQREIENKFSDGQKRAAATSEI